MIHSLSDDPLSNDDLFVQRWIHSLSDDPLSNDPLGDDSLDDNSFNHDEFTHHERSISNLSRKKVYGFRPSDPSFQSRQAAIADNRTPVHPIGVI
jgi:hypothetical protein